MNSVMNSDSFQTWKGIHTPGEGIGMLKRLAGIIKRKRVRVVE